MRDQFNFFRRYITVLALLVSSVQGWSTTCADAIPITTFPIVNQPLVCGTSDDLSFFNVPSNCGNVNSSYRAGNEALYSFVPPTSQTYVINYSGRERSAIFVYSGCPTSGGTCVGGIGNTLSSKMLSVNLTAGITYYIWFDTSPPPSNPCPGEFSISLPLANDHCSNAIAFPAIPLNGNCATVTANTMNATGTQDPICAGSEDDDVWFTFTTPPGITSLLYNNISLAGDGDRVLQVLSGTCSNLTSVGCYDPESGVITGLSGNTTYFLRAYTLILGARSAFNICLRVLAPNDNCAGAIAFPPISMDNSFASFIVQTGNATNSGSTVCNGSADDDVWFTFTPPPGVSSLRYRNSDISGNSDRILQVFSGTCGSLTSIGCYDPESGMISGLTGGVTYYLRAFTKALSVSSTFELCLHVPLANDNCTNAIPFPAIVQGGGCATIAGSTVNATGSSFTTCGGIPDDDIWFSFVPPAGISSLLYDITVLSGSTDLVFQMYRGNCNSIVGCYDPESGIISNLVGNTIHYIQIFTKGAGVNADFTICLRMPPPPPNDNCQGAIAFPPITPNGACAMVRVSTFGATGSADPGCIGEEDDDVWYTFTTPPGYSFVNYAMTNVSGSSDRVLRVYRGSCTSSLISVGCYDPESGVITGLEGNTTYYVRTYTYAAGVISTFDLCLSVPPRPANDHCADAIPFPSLPSDGSCVFMVADTYGATGANDPACTGVEDDDAWYVFTVPPGRDAVIYDMYTVFGNGDRVIQLFEGAACGNLTTVGCYDPENGIFTGLTEGGTYYLRVYTKSSGVGSVFHLCLRVAPPPPPNDKCTGAIAFPDIPTDGSCASVTANTYNATGPSTSACAGNPDDDVWYTFTAPPGTPNLLFQFTDIDGNTDRLIQLLTGNCDSLTVVRCVSSTKNAGVLTGLNGGETYYLRIFTRLGNVGSVFSLCLRAPVANDECAGAIALPELPADGACVELIVDLRDATASGGNCLFDEFPDIWYSFTVPPGVTYISFELGSIINSGLRLEFYRGTCDDLTSLGCFTSHMGVVTGLTGGATHYLRTSRPNYDPYRLCLRLPPPNDACHNAIAFPPIPEVGGCAMVRASTVSATNQSGTSICYSQNGDIWYSFTMPPGASQLWCTITNVPILPSFSSSAIQLYRGDCGNLIPIQCFFGANNLISGLIGGETYYMQVSSQSSEVGGIYDICLFVPAANNHCAGAIAFPSIPLDGSCASTTISTAFPLAPTGPICLGSPSAALWYTFTTPPGVSSLYYEHINISGSPDRLIQVYSGSCNDLTTIGCYDPEKGVISGLSGGTTYYMRIYTWAASQFTTCLRLGPMNDECINAVPFPPILMNGSCAQVTGTTTGATGTSDPTCTGVEDNDVWFTFTTPPGVTSLIYDLVASGGSFWGANAQLFTGSCSDLIHVECITPSKKLISGLNDNTTYYLRVYSNQPGEDIDFTICLRLPPVNDACQGALPYPAIPGDESCAELVVNLFGATSNLDNLCLGSQHFDIWYTFTTPPGATAVWIENTPVTTAGSPPEKRFQVLSGTCGDLVSLGCFTSYGLITGLQPNTGYYLRIFTLLDNSTFNLARFCIGVPPANDDCAHPETLPAFSSPGSCISVDVSTRGASGEPDPACAGIEDNDVWYAFTPPPGATYMNFAFSNTNQMNMQVFSGSNCGNMSSIGCYQNGGMITGLVPNTPHLLRIYTPFSATSSSSRTTTLTLCTPPLNDNCPAATAFPDIPDDGSCAVVNASTFGATVFLASNCHFTPREDIWYTFSTPPGVRRLHYAVTPISGNPSLTLEVLEGHCNNLTSIGCYNSANGFLTGLSGNTTYYLRAYRNNAPSGAAFDICLRRDPAPVNDECEAARAFPAILLDGSCTYVTVSTGGATRATDVPACTGIDDNDVWYTFTTPPGVRSLFYLRSYISGSSDNVFQVFSGNCNNLTPVGCYSGWSGFITGLSGNTTYYLRAYSESAFGNNSFELCLSVPPLNDNCADAVLLGSCNNTLRGRLTNSTADQLPGSCAAQIPTAAIGVWYRLVGTGAPAIINTCSGGNFADTGIAVFTGTCDSLVCVAGGAGGCSIYGSHVSWLTEAGTNYLIYVYLASGSQGDFMLTYLSGDYCLPPVTIEVVNITDSEVSLNWPAVYGVSDYEYLLSATGVCAEGASGTVAGTSTTLSGLSPDTYYTFCVRSTCACSGSDYVSFSFTTLPAPPPNNLCVNSIPVACGASIAGSTENALPDIALGACEGYSDMPPGRGIWYTLAGNGALVSLDLCASSYDTRVHVYDGACGNLVCIAENDDACGMQSNVTFRTMPGVDYFILVNGFDTATGEFIMNISCVCEQPLDLPWEAASVGGAQGTAVDNLCEGSIEIHAQGYSPLLSSDRQFFVFQNFCDTMTITARVNDMVNGGFAGIVFRESAEPGSRMVALKTRPGKFIYLDVRPAANGIKSSQQFLTLNHSWLRLSRSGDTFSGFSSRNGVTWQYHFSINAALASCTAAGLFAESSTSGVSSTGVFTNVSIVPWASTVEGTPGGVDLPIERLPLEYIIYPNPAQSEVNVKMSRSLLGREVTILVRNQLGRILSIRKIEQVQHQIEIIQVGDLPPGVYTITLQTENREVLAKKLVIGAR